MLHRPYFNGSDAVILAFDLARSSTFSNITNWWQSCVKYGLGKIPRILVGINRDPNSESERKIILPMAHHLGKKLNAPYFEVSLVTGENVTLVFQTIAELLYIKENEKEDYKRKDREDIKRFDRPHATFHEDNEIEYCRECGAVGDEIRTNRPPIVIVNNDLNHPKYTCKRCGYNWGSTL